MAAEPVEFTRGSLGAADTRGLSLVERHAEARARALEEETLAKLHSIFSSSQVPLSVLALAASAAPGPDAREAEALVREFVADKGRELEKLFKARDAGGEGAKKAKPSTSSSGDDDDDSDSDEEGRKGRRHRRSSSSKHHKKDSKKHSKKHKKEDKKSKRKKKSRRRSSDSDTDDSSDESGGGGGKDKRQRRAEKAAAAAKPATTTAALTSRFGSRGLLRAENPHDAELKRPEFFSWCSEVKKVPSMEALARWEEAELWKTFVEDFNTATFPSEKYYDLAAWQRQKAREDAKRKGKKGEGEESISAADDEAARRAEAKKRREEEAAERLKEAYNALKYSDAGKKEDMKRQELLRIELQVAARTGDTEKVARLQKLLAPEKPK